MLVTPPGTVKAVPVVAVWKMTWSDPGPWSGRASRGRAPAVTSAGTVMVSVSPALPPPDTATVMANSSGTTEGDRIACLADWITRSLWLM
jgi:hypothetical protein